MKRCVEYLAALVVLGVGVTLPLSAQNGGAKADLIDPASLKALNDMGTYLRSLKDFQVEADVTTEDVLEDGEKVQYAEKTNLLAHMPNQLRAEIDGDQRSRIILYDGKAFTLYARRVQYYATVPAPPTIGELIDAARDKYDVDIPLVDLFLWGGKRAETPEITSATDIGPGDVEGVTCEHYIYRQPGLDWQIWIQLGSHPLPRKLVLTTTTDDARPQHTTILTWNLAPSYNAEAFVFDPPTDAQKIVFGKN